MKKYDPGKIEPKWQKKWRQTRLYEVDIERAERPYYNLMMFPYPSAEGLHVGNMYAFTGADIYGRYQRMKGYDVFEPIGLDGFGIHSENFAIKLGKHPAEQAKISQKNFYRQLSEIGNGFAWEHRLETYDPAYYRWTQWLFIKLYKAGLAYRGQAKVNWCPSCKTVLADEQVEDGECERCKTPVKRRQMSSWYFRITKFADRLLANIDGWQGTKQGKSQVGAVGEGYDPRRDGLVWPAKVKVAQRQWIGKKTGAVVSWKLAGSDRLAGEVIETFTTRLDTIFGVTFIVVAPDHPVVAKLAVGREVKNYISRAMNKSDQQRKAAEKEKTGVDTGFVVKHPLTGEKIPVWIADFVLADVGTGAVMGVPAHDERDFAFAQEHDLPIKMVVRCENEKQLLEKPWMAFDAGLSSREKIKRLNQAIAAGRVCYTGWGEVVNSGEYSGLKSEEVIRRLGKAGRQTGRIRPRTDYHLRDWLISRQRYWGPPIPLVYCQDCAKAGRSYLRERGESEVDWDDAGWYPVPEADLPVKLPEVAEYQPKGDGSSPLSNAPESWQVVKCPGCGGQARRELDVSDVFLDSSWYYLAYPCLQGKNWRSGEQPFERQVIAKWLPVSAYIGGAEHAVLHLLYSRFVAMALHDAGYLPFEEPFPFLYSHGLIIKDGMKMSKSRGNVVNPDDYIRQYGADALRAYLMFLGPYDQGGDFRDTGMRGMRRFVDRLFRLLSKRYRLEGEAGEQLRRKLNRTIKRVDEGYARLRYNVVVAALMELCNEASRVSEGAAVVAEYEGVWGEFSQKTVRLLAPVMPHLAEELWHGMGGEGSVHRQALPEVEERYLVVDKVTIVLQVNGKKKGVLELGTDELPADRKEAEKRLLERVRSDEKLSRWLVGGVKRVVYVPGRLVNLVR